MNWSHYLTQVKDLIAWRISPEHLPYAPWVTFHLTALSMILQSITLFPQLGSLVSLLFSVLTTLVQAGVLYGFLSYYAYQERFLKTWMAWVSVSLALSFAGFLASLLLWMVRPVLGLVWLGLSTWYSMTVLFILKHAFEVNWWKSGLYLLAMTLVSVLICLFFWIAFGFFLEILFT